MRKFSCKSTLFFWYIQIDSCIILQKCFLLIFLPLVPYIYTSCQRPTKNQRRNNRSSPLGEIRTKEGPKNSKTEKVLFIKIIILFPSLIPCFILPRELRPTTESTPTQLRTNKKCFFLSLFPNRIVLIPKKGWLFSWTPWLICFFRKNHLKSDFSCTSRKKSVTLRANILKNWYAQ